MEANMAIFPDLSFLNPSLVNQPQEVDPYQRLQEVIAGINNQPLQGAAPMGTLERVLTAIAQASSVAASNDPGAVLQAQLKAKADQRNAVTQVIQNRQNLVNQATLQAGFQQAEGMSREQAEVRKEGRLFKQKAVEDIREVNLFKQKKEIEKDIQLSANKSLLEQNEAFEAANEEARNRRRLNAAIIDLLPAKWKDATVWDSNAKLLVPNADPAILERIANKKAGIDLTPITTQEQELIVKVNKAAFEQNKEQIGLTKRKVEADITESDRRGRAAMISANAQAQAARNQAYNDNVANWAKKRQVDILSTQYYKTPSGAIISIDEVNKLPINEKYSAIALPAAENIAHQQRLILQMNETIQKSQMDTQQVNQQLQQGDQLTNQIKEDLKTKTPEQIKQQILNSNLPQSEKNRAMEILGIKPTESKAKGGKTIGGSSVPLPNINLGVNSSTLGPGVGSTLSQVPTALSEVFQSLFRKNTPEENLKRLEEQRQRGSFK
jgi:hypothetical protein